jgi:hypothetical protein
MTDDDQADGERIAKTLTETSARYLAVRSGARANCEAYTLAMLPRMGTRLPLCYRNIGVSLALLDRVACCGFGCPGEQDPHRIQRLLGRCVSNASASLALALQGQYDESLLLTRNVGEVANLLLLFTLDPAEQNDWETLEGSAHWNKFRPKKVRGRIGKHNQVPLMAEAEYGVLSEVAVHVGPHTSPQSLGIPTKALLGGYYNGAAFAVCINELASALAGVSLVSKLVLKAEDFEGVATAAAALFMSVGPVRLGKLPEIWKTELEKLAQ